MADYQQELARGTADRGIPGRAEPEYLGAWAGHPKVLSGEWEYTPLRRGKPIRTARGEYPPPQAGIITVREEIPGSSLTGPRKLYDSFMVHDTDAPAAAKPAAVATPPEPPPPPIPPPAAPQPITNEDRGLAAPPPRKKINPSPRLSNEEIIRRERARVLASRYHQDKEHTKLTAEELKKQGWKEKTDIKETLGNIWDIVAEPPRDDINPRSAGPGYAGPRL